MTFPLAHHQTGLDTNGTRSLTQCKKEKQSCWVCSVFLGFCCCISDRLVAQFETKPIRSAASVDVSLVIMVRRLLHRSNPKAGKI